MSLVGYARVSTAEGRQILDRQLDALNSAGCERVFEDHASGAAPERPNLAACLDYLRRGDVLVVLDLDRLGRRASELITLIDELDQRGVGFRAINSPMDTTTPASPRSGTRARADAMPRTGAYRRWGPLLMRRSRSGHCRSCRRPDRAAAPSAAAPSRPPSAARDRIRRRLWADAPGASRRHFPNGEKHRRRLSCSCRTCGPRRSISIKVRRR